MKYAYRRPAIHPEEEAPLAQPRRVLLNHDRLPLSSTLVLIRLLDNLDVRDCDHCCDLRYALIDYVRGLNPLAAFVPDVLVTTHDMSNGARKDRHLVPGAAV